ncbi:MAG: hypothetical protein ACRDSR_07630 [Pseudonocardiaceae bacterium]
MRETVEGELTSKGWIGWIDVLDVLGEDECLWVDLGGVHQGSAPAQLPVGTTHLWSWRHDRWTRVRFDGDRVLATVLTAHRNAQGKEVTARISDGLPWGRDSRAAEWERNVTLVVTEGPAPVTFVEMHSAPRGPLRQ